MNLKKIKRTAAICVALVYCLCTPAYAEGNAREHIVWQENMVWDWIDPQMDFGESDIMPFSSGSVNQKVSAHSIRKISHLLSLRADDSVDFNCSYTPSSASMDFGILSSAGKFYSINTQSGTINHMLGIDFSGDYYIAIRNNSDQSVTVIGSVDY